MPNMTGRPGYWTMEMNGKSSAPYLARTPCVPLFCTLFNRGGNRGGFRLPGADGGSFPLCGPVILGVDQKWLKSDFPGFPSKSLKSDSKLTVCPEKVSFESLLSHFERNPWKSLFSHFWVSLKFSRVSGELGGNKDHNTRRLQEISSLSELQTCLQLQFQDPKGLAKWISLEICSLTW